MTLRWKNPKTGHEYEIEVDSNADLGGVRRLEGAPFLDKAGLQALMRALPNLAHFPEDIETLQRVATQRDWMQDAACCVRPANPLSETAPIRAGFTNRQDGTAEIQPDYFGRLYATSNEADRNLLKGAQELRHADQWGIPRSHYLEGSRKMGEDAANQFAHRIIKRGWAPVATGYESRSRHSSRHSR